MEPRLPDDPVSPRPADVPPHPPSGAGLRLTPSLHASLRAVARRRLGSRRGSGALESAELVHEAWLKVQRSKGASQLSRTGFRALATVALKQVLVDHLRRQGAAIRGGQWVRRDVESQELRAERRTGTTALDLRAAIDELLQVAPLSAAVVRSRFLDGLTVEETAARHGLSLEQVKGHWRFARAWLHRRLERTPPPGRAGS
jgi:RNA polymerase sigma factor (TIGR02999 family)